MGPPAWIVGPVVAVGALFVLGLDFALFASGGGLLIAGGVAFWIGAAAAGLADPDRQMRNAMIVAASIVVCLTTYLIVLSSRMPGRGASSGGPNIQQPTR